MNDRGSLPRMDMLAAVTDQRFLGILSASDEPLSRAEIAARSGISKPAMSDAAIRLLGSGVIVETGRQTGRRGRVATLYRINPQRGYSVGLALEPTRIAIKAMDLAGGTLFERQEALPRNAGTDNVISLANSLLRACASTAGIPLLSAAISVADPVDLETGDVVRLPNSPFPAGHFNPARELELDSGVPLAVDNDVHWATLAERHLGSMADCEDFIYVYCGAGLGAGLFMSGRLHRGARGMAGEIGYLLNANGTDLTETLAAMGLGKPGKYGLDVGAAAGLFSDEPLGAVAEAALDTLAAAVANVAIVMNPRAIVLGGPLVVLDRFFAGLRERIIRLSLSSPEVVASKIGRDGPLEGASLQANLLARKSLGF